jgi:hypothetical protein
MIMIPATTARVPLCTDRQLNEELHRKIQQRVEQTAQASPQAVDRRLAELDHEWDIDRIMEATVASVSLVSLGLVWLHPAWLVLPGVALASLLLHALFGWCPQLPLFRRWGYRTATEIAYERYALKALRGDFTKLCAITTPEEREAIAALEGEGGPAYAPPLTDAADPHIVQEVLEAVRK